MNLSLLVGLLTGSDNLHFGTAFGLLPLSKQRRVAFALAFGVAEVGMTFAGSMLGGGFGGELLPALCLTLAGALVLLAWARGADLARLSGHPAALVLLPLALSVDNLAAGAGLSRDGLPAVLGAGLLSASMAVIGLGASGVVARWLPRAAPPLAGGLMLALAVPKFVEAFQGM
jgi:putative Mn2+ efflux pump MntP